MDLPRCKLRRLFEWSLGSNHRSREQCCGENDLNFHRGSSCGTIAGIVAGAFALRGHEVEADDSDVVGLAEALRGLGDVACGLVAYLLGTFKAKELALGIGRFDDPVGEEGEAV